MIGGSKGCLSVLCPYHANEPRGPWLAVKEERKKRKKRKERVRREGKRQGDLNDAAGLVCLSSIEQGCCSLGKIVHCFFASERTLTCPFFMSSRVPIGHDTITNVFINDSLIFLRLYNR